MCLLYFYVNISFYIMLPKCICVNIQRCVQTYVYICMCICTLHCIGTHIQFVHMYIRELCFHHLYPPRHTPLFLPTLSVRDIQVALNPASSAPLRQCCKTLLYTCPTGDMGKHPLGYSAEVSMWVIDSPVDYTSLHLHQVCRSVPMASLYSRHLELSRLSFFSV